MRITVGQLRNIIAEEVRRSMVEASDGEAAPEPGDVYIKWNADRTYPEQELTVDDVDLDGRAVDVTLRVNKMTVERQPTLPIDAFARKVSLRGWEKVGVSSRFV